MGEEEGEDMEEYALLEEQANQARPLRSSDSLHLLHNVPSNESH